MIDTIITSLPDPLRDSVAAYWQDFSTNAERASLVVPDDSEFLQQCASVWASSEFLALICVRKPELLLELLANGELNSNDGASRIRPFIDSQLAKAQDEAALSKILRDVRQREMLRIGWRDLAGLAELEETLSDLTALADACTDTALGQIHAWHCERFGTPRDAAGNAQQLIVLGMGKLGGGELNYSSDIDLIFAYPEKGETDGTRAFDNSEFFRRVGQRLINALNAVTGDGFVFRVDMRLRPFGDSGPLVMHSDAMEAYYETQGREWERYAMIKARVIAGDETAGNDLLQRLNPFVYRRYLDYGAIESLREMKGMIAAEVASRGVRRNIKLGPGGIREIEFIAQAFQLIYGGRDKALRNRSLFPVLNELAKSAKLPIIAVNNLKNAYVFLRRSENRLQAFTDQQTHELPADALNKLRHAFAMGFTDWDEYVIALMGHVSLVEAQFKSVFSAGDKERPAGEIGFSGIWQGTVETEVADAFMIERGYSDPQAIRLSLQALRDSLACRSLSNQGRDRLDRLMPLLLDTTAQTSQCNEALPRLLRLIETVARRSVYLSLLVENPVALSQLVKLCSASRWIADYLTIHPLLLDDLLSPDTLYRPLNVDELAVALDTALEKVPGDDLEQTMDELRHFTQTQILRIAAADVNGEMRLMVVSDQLSWLAGTILRKVLDLAWADLVARHGRPRCVINGEEYQPGLAIIAYGKLGGIELGYGSDLDIIFLHDSAGEQQATDGDRTIDNSTFFARLAQRIIHLLSTRTSAGVLYEVDTRLRPSGHSGLLVTRIDAFAEYQRNEAWTWEHQALVRARAVAGSPQLRAKFDQVRAEILSRPRDPDILRTEVCEMRNRMREELGSGSESGFDLKQDPGGIADIEFMVQYAVLTDAAQKPELLTWSDNIRQLDALESAGLMSPADANALRDAYRALRRRMHRLKLEEQGSRIGDLDLLEERQSVTEIWRRTMEPD